jgi:predicted nucleic acid-binding protein
VEEEAVADASVVVKWFLEEEFSDQARWLRDDFVRGKVLLWVPSLLFYEVLNALWRSGRFTGNELVLASRSLSKFGLEAQEPLGRALEEIAERTGKEVPTYDASYLALASVKGIGLYTADEHLVKTCPEIARHIRDYQSQEPLG